MIVTIFLILAGIAALLLAYGFKKKEISFSVVGCFIFFILFAWILFGQYTGKDVSGLQYKVGTNCTSIGDNSQNASYNVTTTCTDVYSTYNDIATFWVGLILTIMSAVAFILEFRRDNK